jgi:hypothetical protein
MGIVSRLPAAHSAGDQQNIATTRRGPLHGRHNDL